MDPSRVLRFGDRVISQFAGYRDVGQDDRVFIRKLRDKREAPPMLVIEKPTMIEMLHTQPALADRFLVHMLARNVRVEEDLVDQLFNSSEKRLARALLLMSRYGMPDQQLLLPKMSQETLAEMVGTTRSRVNFFMNKFRDLGFIEYNGGLKINGSLITVVLHD
jgi:predicted XRE-type DNA-binding protein